MPLLPMPPMHLPCSGKVLRAALEARSFKREVVLVANSIHVSDLLLLTRQQLRGIFFRNSSQSADQVSYLPNRHAEDRWPHPVCCQHGVHWVLTHPPPQPQPVGLRAPGWDVARDGMRVDELLIWAGLRVTGQVLTVVPEVRENSVS